MLALEGIKILDFTRNAPGMFCTMVLGDLGADVLMVERPMDAQLAEYQSLVAGINSPKMPGAAPTTTPCDATSAASP